MTVETPLTRVDYGPDWQKLSSDSRHSETAYFITGYRYKPTGTEILVWGGETVIYALDEEGNEVVDLSRLEREFEPEDIKEGVYIEGKDDHGPDDDYEYVVELHRWSIELADEEFAEDLTGVVEIVNSWMEEIEGGNDE